MKYIFLGGIIVIATLLMSKLYMALSLNSFNKYPEEKIRKLKEETADNQLLKTGENIYMVYCTSCHGQDGKGNDGKAHNHTKRISKESVTHAIKYGANNFTNLYPAGMPSNLIDRDEIEKVAEYVANGFKGSKPKSWDKCASCHGDDGEGIAYIAPNIKNYTDELVIAILLNGKKGAIGTMPNFKDRLTKSQMKSIALYIRSLNK